MDYNWKIPSFGLYLDQLEQVHGQPHLPLPDRRRSPGKSVTSQLTRPVFTVDLGGSQQTSLWNGWFLVVKWSDSCCGGPSIDVLCFIPLELQMFKWWGHYLTVAKQYGLHSSRALRMRTTREDRVENLEVEHDSCPWVSWVLFSTDTLHCTCEIHIFRIQDRAQL